MLALVAYSVAIFFEQRKHKTTNGVVFFLTLGIILDVAATAFMIKGSSNSPFTLHGFLGYSALLGMLIDFFLIWKYRLTHGKNIDVSKGLHLYSRYAYLWWVVAFVTGSLLVILK